MFANKVVIITGGSAGIGAATAEGFAKEGASVVIVGRNEVKLKEVAERCENSGAKVLTIKADISKQNEVQNIVKQTVDKFGKLDVLVNNAGVLKFATLSDNNFLQVYDEVLNINLRAAIQLTALAAPYLKETKGNIINVSSISGLKVRNPEQCIYGISKCGLNQFSRTSALELAPFGVRVNVISPGPVETELLDAYNKRMGANKKKSIKDATALGRVSEAEEVSDLILFVASYKARGITGSTYVIDNGVMLK